MEPETRYATTSDGVHIAYRVLGDGPIDLVYVGGFAGNFEVELEEPGGDAFFGQLASFSRLVLFDKRGTGLSDRRQTPDLDMRADDLRAVLDAIGSERAVLLGESEGGALAAFFAATHPGRVLALVLYGTLARYAWAPDYPWGMKQEDYLVEREEIAKSWGTIEHAKRWADDEAPSMASDADFIRWLAKALRHGASPSAAIEFWDVWYGTDVRAILGSVQAPTLVLGRPEASYDTEAFRDLADRIPGAKFIELSGRDYMHTPAVMDEFLDVSERFVQSIRAEEVEIDRVLATVLFTDIVGSTEKAAELGDAAWKESVERHHRTVRAMIGRYRGREIDTAGDGFFGTFDGPARAVRCAHAIVDAVKAIGLDVRAGLHTGEVETIDDKVGGIAVMIGARVGAAAGPSEVLVSSTVKELVAGSGIAFEDLGERELRGIPDRWHLYRALPQGGPGPQNAV